jgi:hypothetical protein
MTTRYLDEIKQRLEKVANSGALHRDTVIALLSLFRQHLEAMTLQQQYRVLMVYSNWSLHTDLDRGIVQDFLSDISAILVDDNESGHPNDKIAEALSLARLRAEIRAVLKAGSIGSGLFDSFQGWKAFLSQMLPLITEKPLSRTRLATTKSYAESVQLYMPDLKTLDPGFIAAAKVKEDSVFWGIRAMPKDVWITGLFVLTEQPEDFSG